MANHLSGSFRQTFTTGAVTTVTAHTATAGHLLGLRNASADIRVSLRAIEAEFLLTTAFTTAQEVAFSAYILREYRAPHTGATLLTFDTGGRRTSTTKDKSTLTGRIADTGALTAGTHTIESNPIARGSVYGSGVGSQMAARRYDFTAHDLGYELIQNEGLLISNHITMGAGGVGKWHFTVEWDEYRCR